MCFTGWLERLVRLFDASGMLMVRQHMAIPGGVNESYEYFADVNPSSTRFLLKLFSVACFREFHFYVK